MILLLVLAVFKVGHWLGRRSPRGTSVGLNRLPAEHGPDHGPTWIVEFSCGRERHDVRLPRDWVLGTEQARRNERS